MCGYCAGARVLRPIQSEEHAITRGRRTRSSSVGPGAARAAGSRSQQGPTHRGVRLRISRPGERALAASGGRSGAAITPSPAGLSEPRPPAVEVMTRAVL
jgi:hypothetical protein